MTIKQEMQKSNKKCNKLSKHNSKTKNHNNHTDKSTIQENIKEKM